MFSLAARPCAPRPGATPRKLLAAPNAVALVAGLAAAAGASGQAADAPAAPAVAASAAAHQHDMSGHDTPATKGVATGEHAAAHMKSALGAYPMSREGSGTSWQPEVTPMTGLHIAEGDW